MRRSDRSARGRAQNERDRHHCATNNLHGGTPPLENRVRSGNKRGRGSVAPGVRLSLHLFMFSSLLCTGCSSRVETGGNAESWFAELPAGEQRSWREFVGDIDGDGTDDLLVADHQAGIFEVVFGTDQGSPPAERALRLVNCESCGGEPVANVTALGDINGDGFDDLAVDSVLVLGGTEAETLQLRGDAPSSSRVIPTTADDLGQLGDLDGDGFHELLVEVGGQSAIVRGRADWTNTFSSALPPDSITWTDSEDVWRPVRGAGDLDGDGCDDLAVLSWGGAVGFSSGAMLPWGTSLTAELVDANLGGLEAPLDQSDFETVPGVGVPPSSLYPVGDINQDGFDDLVIGHLQISERPVSFLVWGSPGQTTRAESELDAGIGGVRIDGAAAMVLGPGDLDLDGANDLLFGAVGERWSLETLREPPFSTNVSRIVRGDTFGRISTDSGTALSPVPGALLFGSDLSSGDFDGDGAPDLIVHYIRSRDYLPDSVLLLNENG